MHQLTDPRPPPVGVNFTAAVRQMRIVDCTKVAKTLGFQYRVGMSRPLFSLLFPTQQEAYKGQTFEERVSDLLKEFKRNAQFAASDAIFFKYKMGTNVTNYVSHEEVHTQKNVMNEEVEVLAMCPDDERKQPCLLFFHRVEYDKYKFREILAVSERKATRA